MALDKYAPIIGTQIRLGGNRGPFPVCGRCAGTVGTLGAGISTHPGHLKCSTCNKHLSWIGFDHMDALLAASNPPARKAGAR